MSHDSEDKPYSDSHLDSPEYRKRLLRKLNTLIAVLEVACSKVRRSLSGPDPDLERLHRIHKNLSDTLQVCQRARQALERSEKMPEDLPANLAPWSTASKAVVPQPTPAKRASPSTGAGSELSSEEERSKFQTLGPIDPREVRSCDIDGLCRRLLA
jgi:hypothetical protein